MISFFLASVGWVAGGVVNWLADTLPGRDLEAPHCGSCGAPRPRRAWLSWVAFLWRARKCPYCGTPISWRHPLVELVAAVAAVAIFRGGWGPSGYVPAFFITMLFLLITIIDIEHRLILHIVSLPSILLVAVYGLLDPSRGAAKTLLGGAVGLGVTFLLFLLGALFARWIASRRGEPLTEVAFGFGDVTLGTLLGLTVGWPGVILSLTIGVLAAGAFSLLYVLWLLLRGRYRPYLPIPYGPFLILGGLLVYLGGSELFLAIGP